MEMFVQLILKVFTHMSMYDISNIVKLNLIYIVINLSLFWKRWLKSKNLESSTTDE